MGEQWDRDVLKDPFRHTAESEEGRHVCKVDNALYHSSREANEGYGSRHGDGGGDVN